MLRSRTTNGALFIITLSIDYQYSTFPTLQDTRSCCTRSCTLSKTARFGRRNKTNFFTKRRTRHFVRLLLPFSTVLIGLIGLAGLTGSRQAPKDAKESTISARKITRSLHWHWAGLAGYEPTKKPSVLTGLLPVRKVSFFGGTFQNIRDSDVQEQVLLVTKTSHKCLSPPTLLKVGRIVVLSDMTLSIDTANPPSDPDSEHRIIATIRPFYPTFLVALIRLCILA
ncbi:hypothetical protein ACMFMG_004133 [Clarireedia jacksonii]